MCFYRVQLGSLCQDLFMRRSQVSWSSLGDGFLLSKSRFLHMKGCGVDRLDIHMSCSSYGLLFLEWHWRCLYDLGLVAGLQWRHEEQNVDHFHWRVRQMAIRLKIKELKIGKGAIGASFKNLNQLMAGNRFQHCDWLLSRRLWAITISLNLFFLVILNPKLLMKKLRKLYRQFGSLQNLYRVLWDRLLLMFCGFSVLVWSLIFNLPKC